MSSTSKSKRWKRIVMIVLVLLLAPTITLWFLLTQPTFSQNSKSNKTVDSEKLQKHVVMLSETFHPRNEVAIENLNKCADYIHDHFTKAGASEVGFQEYKSGRRVYKNVTAIFGKKSNNRIVIGAHYDSCGMTPGADDNASGVAGLIELAYLLQKYPLERTVELVGYTLEEPPNFRTKWMGSYVHAKASHDAGIKIDLMISLEMIGYFTDEKKQSYPFPLLKLFYPNQGNFVAIVSHLADISVTRKLKVGMNGATDMPVYSINAPAALQGIDFSDHHNYWKFNTPALMVTDTAFMRNFEYHKPGDTADRLNYDKMGQVVIAVYEAIAKW
ncbi:M28 family peptidase [Candidatus Uabimicrobium sp. HlEnr_7]|uniref:M28 family peptidase n=1 Tax=Candidatus Uabimicrobium helgolandensis TaxID=3095367 RepID=UPI0035562ADA